MVLVCSRNKERDMERDEKLVRSEEDLAPKPMPTFKYENLMVMANVTMLLV